MISLERDPEEQSKTGFKRDSKGQFQAEIVCNTLFFIDDSMQMFRLTEDEDGDHEAKLVYNLFETCGQWLKPSLRDLATKSFLNIPITERSILLESSTVNLVSGNDWRFKMLSCLTEEEKDEEWLWYVQTARNVESIHRQMLIVSRRCGDR